MYHTLCIPYLELSRAYAAPDPFCRTYKKLCIGLNEKLPIEAKSRTNKVRKYK